MRKQLDGVALVSPARRLGLVVSFGFAVAGCGSSDGSGSGGTAGAGGAAGGAGTAGNTSSGGSAGTGGTGGSASGLAAIKSIFIIVMENKDLCQLVGNSATYINGPLKTQGAQALMYKGPNNGGLHPSEPNYIWLEAGSNLGITNDSDPAQNHKPTTAHLVTQMKDAGVTWRSYQEDITGTVCPLTGVGDYKPKHNPMVFFDDVTGTNDPTNQYCIDHNRPLTELETDLQNGTTAQYNFITPNQCNDMHDKCPPLNDDIKTGDNFLAEWIPKLTGSGAYADGGAVFVTWDEGTLNACCITANCALGMWVLSPLIKSAGYSNSIPYDHSSFVKTVQTVFQLSPLLGHAADATVNDMGDLFRAQ